MIIDGLSDQNENASIDELETEEVNLMFLAIDQSGSMHSYISIMQDELKKFKDSILNSKEYEKILVSRADFSNSIKIRGYKKIDEFDVDYEIQSTTCLYDVIKEGADKLLEYMECLKKQGMRVKAIFAVFSDGCDTSSITSISQARQIIEKFNQLEIVTVFVAFGNEAINEASQLAFRNILKVGQTESELRKAFNQLSKSLISQSKSVVPKKDDFFEL